jgi:hypothetical protein
MLKLAPAGRVLLAIMLLCLSGLWNAAQSAEFVWQADLLMTYSPADRGDTKVMFIDVDADGSEDLEFQIINEQGNNHLAGLDSTRNGGFLSTFDDNDYAIFQTFSKDDEIGPDLEDDIGYETLTHAAYEYDEFGNLVTGGELAESEAYLGFGFFSDQVEGDQDEGIIYGWMLVEFGELIADDINQPDKVFIHVKQIGYNNTVGESATVGYIPEPATMALLGTGALLLTGRKVRKGKRARM